jgi:hypothetical protein
MTTRERHNIDYQDEAPGWSHRKKANQFNQEHSKNVLALRRRRKVVEVTPEVKVQRCYRKRLYSERLHRKNLADRLLFESSLVRGFFRLVNQALIFWLMVLAALQGSDVGVRRGIYNNLIGALRLNNMRDIKSRADFVKALPQLSRDSKQFFTLSSQYFDTLDAGFVQLLGPLQEFSTPLLLGGVDITIQAPSVSFTTWLKTDPLFLKGYILRKRLLPAGYGSELSCWGWHLDRMKGPQLHYGVHDVFPTDADNRNTRSRQVEVGLESETEFEPAQYALLTVIVTQTNVTFWSNLQLMGSVQIDRPITDCFNNNEGECSFPGLDRACQ